AASGYEGVTLAWNPPATDGGSQVVTYTATINPGGWSLPTDGRARSLTWTGLACGQGYSFTLAASNGVGTGPTSPASAVVDVPCPPTSRSLNVPWYHQSRALTCEEAALQMALAYEGVYVSQDEILNVVGVDYRLPYRDGNGLRWGDPYTNFVGNPDGTEDSTHGSQSGYGTYYPTIARAASHFGGTVLASGEGIPASSIYSAVLAGHPVVAWVPFGWTPRSTSSYLAFDNRWVLYGAPWEHAVTVVGVTPDSVQVNNPDTQVEWISKATFEAAYAMFNRMAVELS
ncbi:MAG: C39 family peptidase, partial [Candidatus Dormibacteria bacterium]